MFTGIWIKYIFIFKADVLADGVHTLRMQFLQGHQGSVKIHLPEVIHNAHISLHTE